MWTHTHVVVVSAMIEVLILFVYTLSDYNGNILGRFQLGDLVTFKIHQIKGLLVHSEG